MCAQLDFLPYVLIIYQTTRCHKVENQILNGESINLLKFFPSIPKATKTSFQNIHRHCSRKCILKGPCHKLLLVEL
jgi:hypothetical protein